MAKILVNDGMNQAGIEMLKAAGHEVDTNNIPQEELTEKLPGYDAICVRSATKVRTELIDNCPKLKIIGRGGVGLDNIDVDYAKSKGIHVLNTPAASSRSVAELAMGHLLSVARYIHDANHNMPAKGNEEFKSLKKSYAKGFELEGKKLGVIGFGRIGQETASVAMGLGMDILPVDPNQTTAKILAALESNKVRAAGLDVFIGEPKPRKDLLQHKNISATPHIGASTVEAQVKIGQELAQQIIDLL